MPKDGIQVWESKIQVMYAKLCYNLIKLDILKENQFQIGVNQFMTTLNAIKIITSQQNFWIATFNKISFII